jgi:hypothetical protein
VRSILVAAMLIALAAAAVAAPRSNFAPMDRMKSLHGLWIGKTISGPAPESLGYPIWLEYESVSAGHAVMERLGFGPRPTDPAKLEEERRGAMVSMYHQETDQLMMTHFCAANTQPRVRTKAIPADMSKFQFFFVDSTNILNATMMNIRHFTLEFPSKDVLIQRWQPHDNVKPLVIEAHRVR